LQVDELTRLVTILNSCVKGGDTLDTAIKNLSGLVSEELLRKARAEYEGHAAQVRNADQSTTLKDTRLEKVLWYMGPQPDDRYWPALKQALLQKGWKQEAIEQLDASSTKIVSFLESPGRGVINTRGLVVGYVQSGKTANYSAVITKAADVGYKLFIVLSGLTDKLRNQTQDRLALEITQLNDLNRERWFSLTFPDRDFYVAPVGNANSLLTRNSDMRVLGVVKKNDKVLKRLLKWLSSAQPRVKENCPVLIIDDEADQASVNTSQSKDDSTAINGLIRDILNTLPKAAYIGYTATPFANVLINPLPNDDLYPRDFIIDLPPPSDHFGTERIFGRDLLSQDDENQQFDGLNVIRRIPEEEIKDLKPASRKDAGNFLPVLTPTLKDAIHYFWLATAARLVRNQNDHSTMLIHTTLYTTPHEKFKPLLTQYRSDFLRRFKQGNNALLNQLRLQWEDEQIAVPSSDVGLLSVPFDRLHSHLLDVVQNTRIVIENSRSDQRLEYKRDNARIQIVVGGNILSRGLTLEGLLVSFFLRTASAYDTLLQTGRWFGFRRGYEDLPRIWMTDELRGYFRDMATVEQEIRNDIKLYELEGRTPTQFGVRIRTHPALEITSRLKMQAAIDCSVSFENDFRQTILFNHRDQEWLARNLEATRILIRTIRQYDVAPIDQEQKIIFKDVPVHLITTFLAQYQFHERNKAFSSELLTGYIKDQNKSGDLLMWNVVIVSRKKPRQEGGQEKLLDLGFSRQIPLLNRSRLETDAAATYADLGVIANGYSDIVADLDLPPDEIKKASAAVLKMKRPSRIGLLLLYPIDKDSIPMGGEKNLRHRVRQPLQAVEHLIGTAFAFPKSSISTPQGYKTVNLSYLEREEEEDFQENEEEEE
jgi:hypothetical protein